MSDIFKFQNQFILRVPPQLAQLFDAHLQNDAPPPSIEIAAEQRKTQAGDDTRLSFKIDGRAYDGTLFDLPCIIQSLKTIDNINFFKSNDISQLIQITPKDQQPDVEFEEFTRQKKVHRRLLSGVTPPTKQIVRRFFRKRLNIDHRQIHKVQKQLQAIMQEIAPNNRQQKSQKPKRKYHKKV